MPSSETAYLNHAGTSWPKPDAVTASVQAAQQLSPALWPALTEESHETVADFFHIPGARLRLTQGCTAAIELAISDQPWAEGDCVVTSHFEHHAVQRCLTRLARRGISVRILRPAPDRLIDLNELESILQSDRVRLVAITAACNVTGTVLPYEEVIELAHRYGSRVLIDGAQIAGWQRLDLTSLNADLFAFAGHKGLQAPWGIGGLYVAEQMTLNCPQATCEIPDDADSRKTAGMPGYCDAGSLNVLSLVGLAAACRWLQNREQRHRLRDAQLLAQEFTEQLRGFPELRILHDTDENAVRRLPTVAVSVRGRSSGQLADLLRQHSVIASGGLQCAPQAHLALGTSADGVLRFSFGPLSTRRDVEQSAETLGAILR